MKTCYQMTAATQWLEPQGSAGADTKHPVTSEKSLQSS